MELRGPSEIDTGAHLEPLFLRACRSEALEATPIWLLSQASGYLPEHRRLREGKSLIEVMRSPDLATEATLQPIRRFGFDACTVFADPLVPSLHMGVEVALDPAPRVEAPLRSEEAMKSLRRPDPVGDLGYVLEAIRNLRRELPPTVALMGQSAGPFSLAGFLVEGSTTAECPRLKSLMFTDPVAFHALMEKVSLVIVDYLKAQIESGAQAVFLTDPLISSLSPRDFTEYVHSHLQRVLDGIQVAGVPRLLQVPSGSHLSVMKDLGAEVIGVDWRVEMAQVRSQVGEDAVLQGNLDPDVLFAPPPELEERVVEILGAAGHNHIFNVGHDVSAAAPIHAVEALVSCVHSASRTLRADSRSTEETS